MMVVEVVLLAVLGLVLGSFLNVVAYRLPVGENWVSERSLPQFSPTGRR